MGHLKVLILGKGILQEKEALEEFLQYLEEKPAVAGNLYVFACDKPEELMSLDSQNTDSVGEYLTGILENNLEGNQRMQLLYRICIMHGTEKRNSPGSPLQSGE